MKEILSVYTPRELSVDLWDGFVIVQLVKKIAMCDYYYPLPSRVLFAPYFASPSLFFTMSS